uniref:RING-type domain-containing protein n=1 Tax=Opuntia streptacantha TaxID=393608 RepID=A0A7C9CVR4_OPUST
MMQPLKEMILYLADVLADFTIGRCFQDTLKKVLELQTKAMMEHLKEGLNHLWVDDNDCHGYIYVRIPHNDTKTIIIEGETFHMFEFNDCCPICLEDFKAEDMGLCLVRCRHLFHLHCIDQWLINNASCPTCRRQA